MLTVYGRATSSNVQLVMWTIAELGVDCERLDYGHSFGGLDGPEFGALNPHRLVPVLKDGDVVVWESAAIMRYLGSCYGSAPFWPEDLGARAEVDMWAEWGRGLTRAFTVPVFWVRVRTAAKDRDPAALQRGLDGVETVLDALEAQLDGQDYVVGDAFTAADVAVGHVLYRWFDIDVARRPRPVLEAYYERLTQRPAFRAHVMVDYSVLKVEGA